MSYDPGNNFIDIKGYVDTLAHISEDDRAATIMSEYGRIGYQDKTTTYNTAYTSVWRSRFVTTQNNSSISSALEDGNNLDVGTFNNNTYQIKFLYLNFLGKTGDLDNEVYIGINTSNAITNVKRIATLYPGESYALNLGGDLQGGGLDAGKVFICAKRYEASHSEEAPSSRETGINLNRARVDVVLINGTPAGTP